MKCRLCPLLTPPKAQWPCNAVNPPPPIEVTGEKCEALCRGERHASSCATWQIDTNRHSKLTATPPEGCGGKKEDRASKKRGRTRRDQETHLDEGGNFVPPSGEEAVRETTTTETGFPSSYRIDVPARGEIFDQDLKRQQGGVARSHKKF